jgi:hypothetical protein
MHSERPLIAGAPAGNPSRKEILVIGNSHTTAIEHALSDEDRTRVDVVNIATYFDPVNRRNKLLPREIVDLFQPKRIFCTFGGSECSVFGLLEAPVRFDFMTPTNSLVEPDRELIPHALVRATLERAMKRPILLTRELRALYDCPITYLQTPPPFRQLSEGSPLPAVFQENLHLGISPMSIRKKLYDLHSEIARTTYAAIDVGFLEVPDECTDPDGFLLETYCYREPTHANRQYGALVLKQILEA